MEAIGRVNDGVVGEQVNKFAQTPLFSFLQLPEVFPSPTHFCLPAGATQHHLKKQYLRWTRIGPRIQREVIEIHTQPCPQIDAHVLSQCSVARVDPRKRSAKLPGFV